MAGCTQNHDGDAAADSTDYLAAFAGREGIVKIAGGTAHLDIMNEVARRVRAYNSAVTISIEGGHSALGVQKVAAGSVDIGNTGRALLAEELTENPDLVSFEFARDAVVIVVNGDNPIESVSIEQLRDIYAGKITNWSEFGGSDLAIHPFSYEPGSGTYEIFHDQVLEEEKLADSVIRIATMADLRRQVPRDPSAIGYTGLAETCDE